MVRPTKWRRIENVPKVSFFIPSDQDAADIPRNLIKLEELEAIRLKDLEGLEQAECAAKMQVSRPTFQRILLSAREKIADSLIHGKALHIEGGSFTQNICPVCCHTCGKEWTERFEQMSADENGAFLCPACGSTHIACKHNCNGNHCRGKCRRNGGMKEDI